MTPIELEQIVALSRFRQECEARLLHLESKNDYERGYCVGGIARAEELMEQLYRHFERDDLPAFLPAEETK